MLVIANGAVKSGSTWLAAILLQLVEPKPIPQAFQGPGSYPSIQRDKLRPFLRDIDYRREHYVSKSHFFYERPLLSRYRDVYVFDITRDIPDTLISLYFHAQKKMKQWNMTDPTLDDVRAGYWRYGAAQVRDLVRYHAVWERPAPWIYVSSFERLKADPHAEIAAMARFLRLPVDAGRIDAIVKATSFEAMSGASRPAGTDLAVRFRKGIVGDSKNYFDEDILRDIRRIEAENAGFPRGLWRRLRFAVECHRKGGQMSGQFPPLSQPAAPPRSRARSSAATMP